MAKHKVTCPNCESNDLVLYEKAYVDSRILYYDDDNEDFVVDSDNAKYQVYELGEPPYICNNCNTEWWKEDLIIGEQLALEI